jgi:hypothetical protein
MSALTAAWIHGTANREWGNTVLRKHEVEPRLSPFGTPEQAQQDDVPSDRQSFVVWQTALAAVEEA